MSKKSKSDNVPNPGISKFLNMKVPLPKPSFNPKGLSKAATGKKVKGY